MKFQVFGQRIEAVTIDVEADSEEEAIEIADEAYSSDFDVWDTDLIISGVLPQD